MPEPLSLLPAASAHSGPGRGSHVAEAEVWNQPLCETSGSRFKPSRFNAHVLEPDGSLLLYNSFTGSRCIIPARGAAAAQSYVSAQGSDGPLDELGTYLHTKGYLVEESVDEMARLAYRASLQQFRTDTLQLFLLSAEECNFRCVYCSQQFKRGLMAPDIRHGVRSLVEARIGKLGSLDISWFGGEPMLGFEVIEDLAPYLQDLARRHGVAFSSHITTNGYLLTPARSAQMVEWGISSYQITVDGDAAEHDRHRPLREGGATFQTILENVLAMRELPGPFLVRLRVNFDHSNLPMVAPLLREASECNWEGSAVPNFLLPCRKMGRPTRRPARCLYRYGGVRCRSRFTAGSARSGAGSRAAGRAAQASTRQHLLRGQAVQSHYRRGRQDNEVHSRTRYS